MKRTVTVRRTTLDHREPDIDDYRELTPGERLQMVEELTRTAWAFRDGESVESRLRRDVGRVIRGRR